MTEPTGFRRDIMFLHDLSELMEKHPGITQRPAVNVGGGEYDATNHAPRVSWWLSANYPDNYWKMPDYKTWQREDIERRMFEIIDAFGDEVEWEGNDPNQDSYSYVLTGKWRGGNIRISTARDTMCEKVEIEIGEHEEEQPDPELHETFLKAVPKVKVMVKDTVTEWQCNRALADKLHGVPEAVA